MGERSGPMMGEEYFQGLVLINSVGSQLVHRACSIGVPGKEDSV